MTSPVDELVERPRYASDSRPGGICEEAAALLLSQQERIRELSAFFTKHALGPKDAPSCLVCGSAAIPWPPAIQHLELPGIIVCHSCAAARQANEALRKAIEEMVEFATHTSAVTEIGRAALSGSTK
jgi:hypothetical protein